MFLNDTKDKVNPLVATHFLGIFKKVVLKLIIKEIQFEVHTASLNMFMYNSDGVIKIKSVYDTVCYFCFEAFDYLLVS